MSNRVTKSPFYNRTAEELRKAIGTEVAKLSGKSFSNDEVIAVISDVVTNPHSKNLAFMFEGCAAAVDAARCVPVPSFNKDATQKALRCAVLDLVQIIRMNYDQPSMVAINCLKDIDEILFNVPVGDWRSLMRRYGGV